MNVCSVNFKIVGEWDFSGQEIRFYDVFLWNIRISIHKLLSSVHEWKHAP